MLDPHSLGILAGTFTTAAFVPQAWKVWRTKSAADLSLPTFLIFSAGVFCWLLYGLSIRNTPIILANSMTLAIAISIIMMALRFRRQPHAQPPRPQ